jgi:hypothetical protein
MKAQISTPHLLCLSLTQTGRPMVAIPTSIRGRGRNFYSKGGRGMADLVILTLSPQNQYSQNQFSQGSQGSQPTFNGQNPNSFNKPEHNRPTCQICGKIGHYAIDCYHRMDFAYQGKNPPTKLAAMANASNLNITQAIMIPGSLILVLQTILQPISITSTSQYLSKGLNKSLLGMVKILPIQNIGNTQLHTKLHHFRLRNVLHVPRIASNLLSVHKLCLHNNCSCYFDSNKLLIQDLPTGRILYQGRVKMESIQFIPQEFLKSVSQ